MSTQSISKQSSRGHLYYAKLVQLPAHTTYNNHAKQQDTFWSEIIKVPSQVQQHTKKYSIDSNIPNTGCKSYCVKKYSREDVESPVLSSNSSSSSSSSRNSSARYIMSLNNDQQQQQQQTSPSTLMAKLSSLMSRTRKSTNDLLNSRSISFSSTSSQSTSSSPVASNSPNMSLNCSKDWFYDDNLHVWSNKSDIKLRLSSINIRNLTIFELNCLKQICFCKLQLDFGLNNVQIPKDESIKSIKQSHFALRSKSIVYKLAFYDDLKTLKDESNSSCVFGQSLYKCILNDMRKQRNDKLMLSLECCDLATSAPKVSNTINNHYYVQQKRNSVLYEALDLSSQTTNTTQHNQQMPIQRDFIQSLISYKCGHVPDIVKQCCLHIEKYGLNTVGIFRIDSSKKRIKEIKEIFDSGQMILLDGRYNPLDVACLLKDYLRSLPDPLLTRKLYSAFIYASKLKDSVKKLEFVKNLICLLPVANRDTLQLILSLLDKLKSHCVETLNKQKAGNKMDAFNLAMIFGPNLLQKRKVSTNLGVDKYSIVDDIESVISITKFLIENQLSLFTIDAKTHNDVLLKVLEMNVNELDVIIRRKHSSVPSLGATQVYTCVLESSPIDSSGYSSMANTRSTSVTDECTSSTSDEYFLPLTNSKISTSAFKTLPTQPQKRQRKSTTNLSVNKNVYIKNRAYFPISQMDKKLMHNLNEENNHNHNQKQINSNLLMIKSTKSLTNLHNNTNMSMTCASAHKNALHFVGEQETLV